MNNEILSSPKFKKMILNHIKDCLNVLLEEEISFCVYANLKLVDFNPPLPKDISDNFTSPAIIFELSDYTLKSAHIEKDKLVFHAGFGEEMFESYVSIEFGGIMQIIVDKTPILLNFIPFKKEETKPKTKPVFKLQ